MLLSMLPKSPPFNLERLREVSEGDKAFEQELIDLYLEDTEKRLVLLERAVKTQDLDLVSAESHAAKSASGNIGAMLLYETFSQLEQSSKNREKTCLPELCKKAKDEFEQVKVFLKAR